jgi:outer membrane protein assembly factor BamB
MRTSFLRYLRRSALVIGVATLAGCSMFSNHNPRYDPAELTQYSSSINASVLWSVSLGGEPGYSFTPYVQGGSVYAASPNGNVVRVDAASGAVQWSTSTGARLSAGVGSDGDTTAVVASDGTVIALDQNGKERWRAQASSAVNVPPTVGRGIVAVRSTDYRIQAFDAATGEARWSVQRPGPALSLETNMQMLIVDNLLVSGLPNGRLMAIDLASGNVQWEGTVSTSYGATDLERINDVVGTPQLQGPLLCGVTYQGRIVCFNIAQGGAPVWEQPFSSNTGMTSDTAQVYAPTRRDAVYAFRLSDGAQVWKQDALANRHLSGPAITGPAVAVGDFEGYVHFLSRTDGSLMGRIQVGGDAIKSPLVATDRGVLVLNSNGNLVLVGVN